MRTAIPLQLTAPRCQGEVQRTRLMRHPARAWTFLLIPFAALLLAVLPLAAQAPAAHPASTSAAHKPAHPRKRPGATHQSSPTAQAAPPVAPPAPKPPDWPANNHPASASVVWDSHGLRIDAENSSLAQILKDVSTATGAKVQGFSSDERVFGSYGPGKARDVLSQLLDGSAYNMIMVGDQEKGAPLQIVLSLRHAGAQPVVANSNAASSDEDADVDEQPQPQTPPPQPVVPLRPGFGPGAPPRTPQQIMQELQQRQQQLQQTNNPQF
jgi:hypothetical protein